ncbi:hypothetical protein DFH08DRAFT_804176 [Mycena albidolilacea]|uniref:Uncharacterized protein n=1 Tax=Mycena albidolilacea TaxID=1033008 RepID=A0AAD7ABE8_9AGAR|nr:hypothetical protein DFH08DRAFT_804176 [Mycena albidolilacea]
MFPQAAELPLAEIKSYRNFSNYPLSTSDIQAFTKALGNPAHNPFFSVENVLSWMTSLGYQLYVLHNDSVESAASWNPEDASTKDLKAYRSLILSEKYQTHPFFSLENLDAWINPPAFKAYIHGFLVRAPHLAPGIYPNQLSCTFSCLVFDFNPRIPGHDEITSYETLKAERDTIAEHNKASLERQRTLEAEIKSLQEQMKLDKHRSDLKEEVIAIRRDVDNEKSLRREWNIHRGEIVKELEQLRKVGLAGVRLKGRRPSERPSGNATTSPTAVDLNPINPGPSTSGPHLHEAVGAGNQIFLDVDRVNNSIPSALSNHSPESENIAFDTTLTDLNPQFLDEFLANLNPDSFTTLFPDSGSNFGLQEYYHDHGFSITERSEANDDGLEYIVPPTENLNQSGLRASQELPPLPAPPLVPSPSPAELEEPVKNPVDGGPDHIIAPRDIDLDLNEWNIVSGKHQHTQSTRAADMAVARPEKRGSNASRKDEIQLDWEKKYTGSGIGCQVRPLPRRTANVADGSNV